MLIIVLFPAGFAVNRVVLYNVFQLFFVPVLITRCIVSLVNLKLIIRKDNIVLRARSGKVWRAGFLSSLCVTKKFHVSLSSIPFNI